MARSIYKKYFHAFSQLFFSEMTWRSQKILALLPPPETEDSNLESDDDPESITATPENFHHESFCSSCLPSGMSDFLDNIIERDFVI